MTVVVEHRGETHVLAGTWPGVAPGNAFLGHLEVRRYSALTVRAYAFDLVNLGRFLEEHRITLDAVVPTDIFDWVGWQTSHRARDAVVVPIAGSLGAAPASVNRRVAAARAFFEHQVLAGSRDDNPVPSPRRGQGLRPKSKGVLGQPAFPVRRPSWRRIRLTASPDDLQVLYH